MASQITGVSIVCSTVCSGEDQRNHQSSAYLIYLILPRYFHDKETLPALLAICKGNQPVTGRFPSQRVCDAEFWCFISWWSGSFVELTIELTVIQDAMAITWCHCNAALSLQWRHNERDGVSNHQLDECLLKRLFRCRSKETSKLRVTGLCEGNSPVTGEFPAQSTSNTETVSSWWRHHGYVPLGQSLFDVIGSGLQVFMSQSPSRPLWFVSNEHHGVLPLSSVVHSR